MFQLLFDTKNCYQVLNNQVITKILTNIRNIEELAVKIEKSNCNRLHSRCKLTEVKNMLFWEFAC